MNGVRTLKGGRIKRIEPFKRDLAPSLQLQAFAQQPYNHARIRHPMVRKSWLSGRRRAGTHAVLPHHPPYGSVVGGYLWLH